jgi:hypothetical protein
VALSRFLWRDQRVALILVASSVRCACGFLAGSALVATFATKEEGDQRRVWQEIFDVRGATFLIGEGRVVRHVIRKASQTYDN